MSVRFDAAADRLLRTSDLLNYNSAYTWMAWVRIVTDTNAFASFFNLNDSSNNNFDYLGTTEDGTTLLASIDSGGSPQDVTGSELTAGTWYHLAAVRVSATSYLVYLNGTQEISNAREITGRSAVARMEHGAWLAGNSDPFNGRIAYIKAWSTNLSAAEVAQEMRLIRPVRTANLYGWWPALPGTSERLRDYSGNGRNWTEAGTLTDEDPPPVTWGTSAITYLFGVVYTQAAFRFRNDNGSETTATWRQTQNTDDSIAEQTRFRLRFLLNTSGDAPSQGYKLQYRRVGVNAWRDVP